jgi:hypothetical protein
MEIYAHGPHKADLVRAIAACDDIDLAASFAYSDSATDLPLLEAVGHPVVVNPDRVLARVARQREWPARQFVQPVRLRDRVPVPPVGVTAAAATVAFAALTVVVGALAKTAWRARLRRQALPPPPAPTWWERANARVARAGRSGARGCGASRSGAYGPRRR